VVDVTAHWTNPMLQAEYDNETLTFDIRSIASGVENIIIVVSVTDGKLTTYKSFGLSINNSIAPIITYIMN